MRHIYKLFTVGWLFIYVLFVGTLHTFAQGENNIWHFGYNAALDFSSGDPVFVSGSQIHTDEASASVSDADGNLLFYTDGETIWDKNHNIMPNGTGLLGNHSTSQVAIVPDPGNLSRYYVITPEGWTGGCDKSDPNVCEFGYSVVDMTLNGGTGDVVPGMKNIILFSPTAEKCAVAYHQSGCEYWIIGHDEVNNNFHVYLLDKDGITGPVTSPSGANITSDLTTGYLVASPDNSKLALATNDERGPTLTRLYDFDNATGIISNMKIVDNEYFSYGVAFSPDSKLLYVLLIGSGLYQYDATNPDPASTGILVTGLVSYSSLSLAADDRIYIVPGNGSNIMHRINSPNTLGLGCDFEENAFTFPVGATPRLGIPIQVRPLSKINAPSFTLGNDTVLCGLDTLVLNAGASWDSYRWSNQDSNQITYITTSGQYWVNVFLGGCHANSDTININYQSTPTIQLNSDTIICTTDEIILIATGDEDYIYWWDEGSDDSILTVNAPGTYQVFAGNSCDTVMAEIVVFTKDCDCLPYIPNAFSPNGDVNATNATWNIYHSCTYQTYGLEVYDRWGNLIFQTNDSNTGWDGKYKGKNAASDVYIWSLYAKEENGQLIEKRGTLTLIK